MQHIYRIKLIGPNEIELNLALWTFWNSPLSC